MNDTTSKDEPDVMHLAFSLSPTESRIGGRMETADDRAACPLCRWSPGNQTRRTTFWSPGRSARSLSSDHPVLSPTTKVARETVPETERWNGVE